MIAQATVWPRASILRKSPVYLASSLRLSVKWEMTQKEKLGAAQGNGVSA